MKRDLSLFINIVNTYLSLHDTVFVFACASFMNIYADKKKKKP